MKKYETGILYGMEHPDYDKIDILKEQLREKYERLKR
jgi:hypothetical protein